MRHRLDSDDAIAFGFLALIEFARRLAVANRKIGGFHVCPSQVAIPVLRVAFAFLFSIGDMNTTNTAAIRGVVANTRKSFDAAGFEKNDCGEDRPDTRDCFEEPKSRITAAVCR